VRSRLSLALAALLLVGCVSTTTETVTSAVRVRATPPPASHPPRRNVALVTRVVDGDTARVRHHGRDVTIRFIGVDTPETVAPGQPVECYGPEASAFTTQRLSGRTIRLEFDVDRIDPYGRTLAYLWMPDGSMFNETLVRRGYATVGTYPPDTKYVGRFETAEGVARSAARGLWGAC
jgi:micrococcal nuclease